MSFQTHRARRRWTGGPALGQPSQGWRGLPLLFLALIALMTLSSPVRADDDGSAGGAGGGDNSTSSDGDDSSQSKSFLQNGKGKVQIESISPARGPRTGGTRVTVRGVGNSFTGAAAQYPEPKCRFGSDQMVVAAAYVACPAGAREAWQREAKKNERTRTCLQCEDAPRSA